METSVNIANSFQPTEQTYNSLLVAYDYFNAKLFDNQLPTCLVTLQRKKGAKGYFSGNRFQTREGNLTTDEIALNPSIFAQRTLEQTLSTLVHEMAHLWQHHNGKTSLSYHNKEWGLKMDELGLTPTSTGAVGGKRTGKRVTHMIVPDGPYAIAYQGLIAGGYTHDILDEIWTDERKKAAKAKAKSKSKFYCASCDTSAWAKSTAKLICGECEVAMICETPDEDA
jgi:predicted SprT family Zn-dependent metalloprotease